MNTYNFNANEIKNSLINWIKEWFEQNGKGCKSVLGLSGGKDSTIVAALCAKALGAENVIGVSMPDGNQSINEADEIAKYLGIKFMVAPITEITSSMKKLFVENKSDNKYPWNFELSSQAEQNIPPRARMMMLYAISQSNNGRVIGTCNFSENWIGYFTLHGDGASDVEPIGNLTVTELLQVGDALGLPKKYVYKTPDDGLPFSCSDEEKFGFTYATLDKYIRGLELPDQKTKEKIDKMHKCNLFKLNPVKMFIHDAINPINSLKRMENLTAENK